MRLPSLLLTLIITAAACTRGPLAGSPDDRSLIVGRAADAISLDPARITDSESVEACEQIYEHLVRQRPGDGQIEPELARSWEHADDLATWTFHLREGVRFHDGSPFDADAVLFSFDRQRDPRHPAFEKDFTSASARFFCSARAGDAERTEVAIVSERMGRSLCMVILSQRAVRYS